MNAISGNINGNPNRKGTHILIVFESQYGQSAKIAHHLAKLATMRGHASTVLHVDAAAAGDLGSYSAVLVVGPIYDRHHAKAVDAFVRQHADQLSGLPSALVSVSMGAGSPRPSMRGAMDQLARTFLEDTGWRAARIILAGGAIAYPSYTRAMRFMMKFGAWYLREPTDTSRIQELTDWRRLDAEVGTLLGEIEVANTSAPLSATKKKTSDEAQPIRLSLSPT